MVVDGCCSRRASAKKQTHCFPDPPPPSLLSRSLSLVSLSHSLSSCFSSPLPTTSFPPRFLFPLRVLSATAAAFPSPQRVPFNGGIQGVPPFPTPIILIPWPLVLRTHNLLRESKGVAAGRVRPAATTLSATKPTEARALR